MKKIPILILFFFISGGFVHGQSMGRTYKNALGLKVWDGIGVSFKTFVVPQNAVEIIGYFNKNSTRLTGLYEIHNPVPRAPGLRWYIGPGAHLAFYDDKDNDRVQNDRMFAGLDGVLGLDYKVNRAPLNISVDWQPSFEFGDNRGFEGSWGGIGIRYTF